MMSRKTHSRRQSRTHCGARGTEPLMKSSSAPTAIGTVQWLAVRWREIQSSWRGTPMATSRTCGLQVADPLEDVGLVVRREDSRRG